MIVATRFPPPPQIRSHGLPTPPSPLPPPPLTPKQAPPPAPSSVPPVSPVHPLPKEAAVAGGEATMADAGVQTSSGSARCASTSWRCSHGPPSTERESSRRSDHTDGAEGILRERA